MLRDLNHTVVEAGSAEEAHAALGTVPLDVILTDIGLPGISGAEFASQVRQTRPELPIVFATGADQGPEGLPGAKSFLLQKPYDQSALAEILQRTMADRNATLLGYPL